MARKNRLIAAANLNLQEIEPLTQNQLLAFEADNNLVLHGVAGTGKSFISCYLGFDDILKNEKERIVLIRSAVPLSLIHISDPRDVEESRMPSSA